MKLYSVIFKSNGKAYYFNGEDYLKTNDYVIVETEKGFQYGQINALLDELPNSEKYKNIIRQATEEDENNYYKLLEESQKALQKCKELVKQFDLNMNVISADFTFDKSQLMFSFVSDERVDFRELAKKLASIYHTRIELRQVGARDKAKEIGGVGVCGQNICCGRFLDHIDAISMNMAKNQNLALNPSKINGLCGRLLCCLQYEDENYIECSKGMPSVGETIKMQNGDGKVISVDVLNRKCKVLIGSNKEEIEFGNKNARSIK
ncbi:MAG: stage 0 sporulation protein [Firmicutes bacterium]|nr:stage 0 sporulation protein [Bacillota bacterium]